MSLPNTLRVILSHPLNRGRPTAALLRYAGWQLRSRLVPGPAVLRWLNGAKLRVERGEAGTVFNAYCGLHDFEDMGFTLHFLRPGDLFADVGANAGAYTVLACAAAGARGVALEPVPDAFRRLSANVALNGLQGRVACHNVGAGERDGMLRFSDQEDCVNHVLAEGEPAERAVEVRVRRLDDVLAEPPALMKVDVEGFETPVLRGAERTLASPALRAVIMELNGSGRRYGFDEEELHRGLLRRGFSTFSYDPFARALRPLEGGRNERGNNTLYVRAAAAAETAQRLAAAPRSRVLGRAV